MGPFDATEEEDNKQVVHEIWHIKTGRYIMLATVLVINDILSKTYYYIISDIFTKYLTLFHLLFKEEKKKLIFVVRIQQFLLNLEGKEREG